MHKKRQETLGTENETSLILIEDIKKEPVQEERKEAEQDEEINMIVDDLCKHFQAVCEEYETLKIEVEGYR